ncbi:MAG: hypothetical protein GC154_10735 [bacterium]|nr:hypothetical protein [bacterium]
MSARAGLTIIALSIWLHSAAAQPFSPILNAFELTSANLVVAANQSGYFPILTSLEDMMFTVYRGGSGHLGVEGSLLMKWSMDSGINWQSPDVVIDGPVDDRNPAVCMTQSGRIIVAYLKQASYTFERKYDPSMKDMHCMVTWSDDLGAHWTSPKSLGVPALDRCSPFGRIVHAANGDWLLTVYGAYSKVPGSEGVRDDLGDYAYLVRSSDEGETWGEPVMIAPGHNETALYSFGDGRILAAARTTQTQRLNLIVSADDGRTWGSPLRLTNPYQHPGDFVRLSNGWLLLLYGDRSQTFKTIRGFISKDDGLSWNVKAGCVFSRPVQGDFGYPSGVLLTDGTLAIQYYWAGQAENAYDNHDARLYTTLLSEKEFLLTYQNRE